MLYREFTSMEKTIGSAMDARSGPTGFSFIKVSFMKILLYNAWCVSFAHNKSHTTGLLSKTGCVAKKVETEKSTQCFSAFTLTKNKPDVKTGNMHKTCRTMVDK